MLTYAERFVWGDVEHSLGDQMHFQDDQCSYDTFLNNDMYMLLTHLQYVVWAFVFLMAGNLQLAMRLT